LLPGGKLILVGDIFLDGQTIASIRPSSNGSLQFTTHANVHRDIHPNIVQTDPMTKEELIAFFKAYSGAGSDEDWDKIASVFLTFTKGQEPNAAT